VTKRHKEYGHIHHGRIAPWSPILSPYDPVVAAMEGGPGLQGMRVAAHVG
jgi:hypothetical protein